MNQLLSVNTYKRSIDEWHKLLKSGVLADKSVEVLEGNIIEKNPESVEHNYANYSLVL